MLPNAASFLVTEDCNLACTYCFEKHNNKKMTKEIARKGLEYLCNNAIKEGQDHFNAMIFGGEPTLEPDIIEEILSYGVKLARENNIIFTSSMVTNATILTDRVKQIIRRYKNSANLSVQLSVDGIKEVHNIYRVTKTGKGSFDLIEKNIEGWKELFDDNIHSLSVHGCCNKKSLPYLYENYKFFREVWDIPRIWFMPIHSEEWDEQDVNIYEEQLNKIADYILDRVKKEGNSQEVVNYAPIDKCFNPDVRPSAPCGAGKNFITITADGKISPCHHFYFNDPGGYTLIGDLWSGIDDQRRSIFISYDNDDISCAKDDPECDAFQCYRCIADNWCANGSILSQITGHRCDMSKIERKIQVKIRGELHGMGLLNNSGSNNGDCRCNLGEPRGCDVVSDCSGNKRCIGTTDTDLDTIAGALRLVLEKIDLIEKEQALILKKIL